jgi:hypothetical protein
LPHPAFTLSPLLKRYSACLSRSWSRPFRSQRSAFRHSRFAAISFPLGGRFGSLHGEGPDLKLLYTKNPHFAIGVGTRRLAASRSLHGRQFYSLSLPDLAYTPSIRSVNLACLPVRLLVFPLLQLSFAHWSCRCCFVGLLGVFAVVAWSFVVVLLPLLPAPLPLLPDPCPSLCPFCLVLAAGPCLLASSFAHLVLCPGILSEAVSRLLPVWQLVPALGRRFGPLGRMLALRGPIGPLGASLAPWGDLDPVWGLGVFFDPFWGHWPFLGPDWGL